MHCLLSARKSYVAWSGTRKIPETFESAAWTVTRKTSHEEDESGHPVSVFTVGAIPT